MGFQISGAIIALIFSLVASNLSIIPTSCVMYDDIIWGFAVPMGIPLLLLQCNIKRIWRETGRMLIIFLIGAAGTVVGAFIAYSLLHNAIPGLEGVAAIMTGSYIGGGVNFAAVAAEFDVGEIQVATTVADNLLMALYFFALIAILNTFFGSQYVWITTFAMLVATFGEKQVAKLNGSQELGTYLIYLFLFVIEVPASIVKIITETPLLLLFTAIIVLTNMIFCFGFGKLLKFDLEDCILASNANIGGPTTVAGMAISQGWSKLVGPVMLIGTFGYVIGTYLGIVVGGILGA